MDTRPQRWTVLIVTNGRRTEFDYLSGLKVAHRSTINHCELRFLNGAPEISVPRAAQLRDDLDHDEAWIVCDVDEFNLTAAVAQAQSLNVSLALSVPSFEVWLILHLGEGCPPFNDARQAVRFLQGILPGWNKEDLNFTDFRDHIDEAVEGAKRLGEPPRQNPSTGVWRLVESLRTPRGE
jgi:hypothetical protein